jgi:hypothetical protein
MHRARPDGARLAWRIVPLDAALTKGLRFFIESYVDGADPPSRDPVEHVCVGVGRLG